MEKFITYRESDLKLLLEIIHAKLDNIVFWAGMMKEQSEGKRENMTMADSKEILSDVEKIKITLKSIEL